MTSIRRLTDSCLLVTTDTDATLFDPGFHTFGSGEVDLQRIGDVTRVLITHEHGDHVHPEFVRWLRDRRSDLSVHTNDSVRKLLAGHGLEATTEIPDDTLAEDLLHEPIPTGATPPNRAWTIEGLVTHPGDTQQITSTAPALALPLVAPWTSTTAAVAFARRLKPRQVIPIHDFFASAEGRRFFTGLAGRVLAEDGIELVPLDWGHSYTV